MSDSKNSKPTTISRINPGVLERVRRSEEALVRSRSALEPVLAHAENVRALNDPIRSNGLSVKVTYDDTGLDYNLAKNALYIGETVEAHEKSHPEVSSFGPSLVLLVREAEKRLAREERSDELPELISDIARGLPRSAVREKYLPPREVRGPAAVLAAVKAGNMERARRAFDACDDDARKALQLLARGLALIADYDRVRATSGIAPAPSAASASLEDALQSVVS